ncbi:MAG: class I SAM-dependent methyltransferase [Candidatus Accumulibacter sp.]|nr:class I SAM-dependent methyltransferase [Accumulibacter sp.]
MGSAGIVSLAFHEMPVSVQSPDVRSDLTMTSPIFESRPLQIVLIQPEGYAYSGALAELAETLIYGLDGLGADFSFSINEPAVDAVNIVLGAHLLGGGAIMRELPADTIIYNSEQVDDKSTWISGSYMALLRRLTVWDYSEANAARLRSRGVKRVRYVPIGYAPRLTRIPMTTPQDIDVLFYGAINERRKNILEALIARGLRIEFLDGVYREERDRFIARAKLVLNMHYYDAGVFEIVRVSYLLANERAVVAECNEGTALETDMRAAVYAAPYDKLVDACAELVADADQRVNLARRGFEIFARRDEKAILSTALGWPPVSPDPAFPALLNLGSGRDWRENCLNVDTNEAVRPDALLDIGQPLEAAHPLMTRRFGAILLRHEVFDAIFANQVLEHIHDLMTAMSNCLRLLKSGGTFHIYVPYDLSLGAWQHPTHIRAFNENSWQYYTDWYWYMGWTEARFERLSLKFQLSEYGEQIKSEGRPLEELLRTPRAIDGMSIILRKRYLLESETALVNAAMHRPWDEVSCASRDTIQK